MGVFDKFLRRKSSIATAPPPPQVEVDCPHVVLMGRWDSVQDMGKDELATAYICGSCQQTFTPEEGRRLRDTTAERLRIEGLAGETPVAEGEGSSG